MNRLLLPTALAWLTLLPSASAEYVVPQMGGGQVGQGAASMKHADITFDGASLQVHVDETVNTPLLRALDDPYEFDPAQPWSVLNDKAYNFQYGWNPGGFITLPSGSWIWIEQLSATPGVEIFQRPPATPAYTPIFGTDSSPARWRWSGSMTHNAYAVADPQFTHYEAQYRVYLGDNTSGEPLAAYGSAEVTFEFLATPVLPGDFNDDGAVDAADYSVWRNGLGSEYSAEDYELWKDHFGEFKGNTGAGSTAVPEPTSIALSVGVIVGAWVKLARRSRSPTRRRANCRRPFPPLPHPRMI